MDLQLVINQVLEQKKNLLIKLPHLEHFLIDISISKWDQTLSFLPIRCFRDFFLRTSNEDVFVEFLSSGTTEHQRARHSFSKSALYDYKINSCQGFSEFLTRHGLDQKIPIFSLIPTPTEWPTNSLAAMIGMFAHQGFQITWCSLDNIVSNHSEFPLLKALQALPSNSSCLIFGTTFHHLMLSYLSDLDLIKSLQNEFSRLRISIIDTGGTKGRTKSLSLNESKEILQKFYTTKDFSFYSEYGMCELASQSWSQQKLHDGSFISNQSLIPLAISIDEKYVLPHGKNGFMAFIDTMNKESWCCIITEDIGFTTGERTFNLIGRAPDASLKGCSLNIRSFFTFEKESTKRAVHIKTESETNNILLSRINQKLSDRGWSQIALQDLHKTLSSIEGQIPKNSANYDKNILIISAANTPISWVYSYLIAAVSGAKSVTIKIPSLRLDDLFALTVRTQTEDLISCLACYFPKLSTFIDTGRSISQNFHQYDIIIAHGTNETLNTLQQQISHSKTQFIGKGDIKNTLCLNANLINQQEVVHACSLWNGRGCLTPVALFLTGTNAQKSPWIEIFTMQLEIEFSYRLRNAGMDSFQSFFHAHNTAFVFGQLKAMGLNAQEFVFRGLFSTVINLSTIPIHIFDSWQPDFTFGGSGFVYILPEECHKRYIELKEINPFPNIEENF